MNQYATASSELLDRSRILTMLHCVETPARGAETLFCETRVLYSNLSDEQRAFLESDAGEAKYSNEGTAGGPAAIDASFGLRMNATGTRRIRTAQRRRPGWKPNPTTRRLVGVGPGGEGLFWPSAKNFEGFVGVESKKESEDILEKVRAPAPPLALEPPDAASHPAVPARPRRSSSWTRSAGRPARWARSTRTC